MAYKTENIIQGAAELWLAAGGTALPALTANAPAKGTVSPATGLDGSANWLGIGFTSEGVEVEYAPEYTDVEVDQLLDAAVIFKTKQTVTVNTTLAEATLENLLYVWGLKAAALKTTGTVEGGTLATGEKELGIDGGSLNDFPNERSLAFVGSAPRATNNVVDKERLYMIRRVLQTESSTHGLKRSEATMLPVSFRCLPDPSKTGAGYGFIRDRKITA